MMCPACSHASVCRGVYTPASPACLQRPFQPPLMIGDFSTVSVAPKQIRECHTDETANEQGLCLKADMQRCKLYAVNTHICQYGRTLL